MGYDHSLSMAVRFKPGVAKEQVIAALKPITTYFNWSSEKLLNDSLGIENSIEWLFHGEMVKQILLETAGEVGHNYEGLVKAVAANLDSLALPGMIDLRDHSTGDLENAISEFWYGAPAQTDSLIKQKAWRRASDLLIGAGVSAETVAELGILFSDKAGVAVAENLQTELEIETDQSEDSPAPSL